jgi:hypothetical protein
MKILQKWTFCKHGNFAKNGNLLPKAIASHLDCLLLVSFNIPLKLSLNPRC